MESFIPGVTQQNLFRNGEAIRLVLADDQAFVRLGIRVVLEQTGGFEIVGEASSGHEAIRLVQKLSPDVLVMELRLPDMSGIKILEKMRALRFTPRVLVLSAYDDAEYIRWLLEHGVGGYLKKRVDVLHFVEAVRGVARGEEGWLSPSVAKRVLQLRKKESKLNHIQLTQREEAVLSLLLHGKENSEIADDLCVSTGTVKNHLTNIYEKLGVRNRIEAVIWAYNNQFQFSNSYSK